MRNSIYVIKAACRIYQKTMAFESIGVIHTCTRIYPDGTVIHDKSKPNCKLQKKNIPTMMRVKEQGQPTLYNFYQQTIDKDDSDDNDSDSTNEFIVQNCFFSTYTPEDLPQEFSQDRFYKIYQKKFKAGYNFHGKSAPMSIYGSTMHACQNNFNEKHNTFVPRQNQATKGKKGGDMLKKECIISIVKLAEKIATKHYK